MVQFSLAGLLVFLAVAFEARPAQARQVLLIGNGNAGGVSEYDAASGTMISPNFLNGTPSVPYPESLALDGGGQLFEGFTIHPHTDDAGVSVYDAVTGAATHSGLINLTATQAYLPSALAIDGNNHLFIANALSSGSEANAVGKYNATTGATVNATFITGLHTPAGLALDGNNHLFVANNGNNTVGEYDATTGAAVNTALISGLNAPAGLVIDSLGHLLVANNGNNTVSEYDAATGATINAAFVSGLNGPYAMALDGTGDLFVANLGNDSVGEYNAITGATINANFITGLNGPSSILFSPVPEPSSLLLLAAAATAAGLCRRRTRRQPRSGDRQ